MSPPRFGPFIGVRPIGQGGMGQVWLAEHPSSGTPVAVKVAFDRAQGWLVDEIRTIAGLAHPHVVRLFDHGRLDARSGDLPAGTPWLAMELASGGSLADTPLLPWPRARAALIAVLDALAHAHAHRIVHRDVKPANVLRCTGTDDRPGYKLTDFGIALALAEPGVATHVGSLPWMAPEQIRGGVEALGPWTDLYAVGVVAHQLVTGRLPFEGTNDDVARAHLFERPRIATPLVPVPAGLEGWIRALLEKAPEDRYQRAADAAWALLSLGDADEEASPTAPRAEEAYGTTFSFTFAERRPIVPGPAPTLTGAHVEAPPLPRSWRTGPPVPPVPLEGVGLGLLGTRALPMIGREAERDALWDELVATRDDRRTRIVAVEGEPGVGRTRLLQWLAARAGEVGGALPVWVAGSLLDTLAAQTGLRHRSPEAVHRFLLRFGPPPDDLPDRILTLLDGSTPQLAAGTLHRLLVHCTARRAVLVVVDDVDRQPEALAFVEHLAAARALWPAPLLVVVAGAAVPASVRAIADRVVPVGPLPDAEMEDLLRHLLPVPPALASALVARAAGRPAYLGHALADLARRSLLVADPQGFTTSAAARAELPALGRAALEHLAPLLADPDEAAVVVAVALLGPYAEQGVVAEVTSVAAVAAAVARGALVEAVDGRLGLRPEVARREHLRELRSSDWGAVARRCAAALEARGAPGEVTGRLWLEAGEHERAAALILPAGRTLLEEERIRVAEEVLGHLEATLQAAGAPVPDELPVLQSWVLRNRGLADAASTLIEPVVARAAARGDSAGEGRALLALAASERKRRRHDAAREALVRALTIGEALGDAWITQGARFGLAALEQVHDLSVWQPLIDELAAQRSRYEVAQAWYQVAAWAEWREDRDAAWHALRQCLACCGDDDRLARTRGSALNLEGELLRQEGRPHEARIAYEQAAALLESLGLTMVVFTWLNLAVLDVRDGAWEAGKRRLHRALWTATWQREEPVAAHLHLWLAAIAAKEQDWPAFDEHLAAGERLLPETFPDSETGALLEAIAADAEAAGRGGAAGTAWRLAAEIWRRYGNDEAAARAAACGRG